MDGIGDGVALEVGEPSGHRRHRSFAFGSRGRIAFEEESREETLCGTCGVPRACWIAGGRARRCPVSRVAVQALTLLWSLPALEFPFFVHMQKELRAEAEAIGGITLIETDGENSAPKQTADVEAAVIQGVDGIIISPIDRWPWHPRLQAAVDAGIPVVTIDRRVDGVTGILATSVPTT